MSNAPTTINRRTLLKMLGAAGASGTVLSACGDTFGVGTAQAEGLTGAGFEKNIALATAGPGGNPSWQPGDAAKFLPAEAIPTSGRASDALSALSREKQLQLYRQMQANRQWEATMKDLFLSGDDGLYGAFHASTGEEGVAVGVMAALNEDDYIASTHRGHAHLIAKGGDLNKMSAEIFFKETGYNKGYGGSMHITDMSKGILGMNGIVGASYYMAAGAALSAMVRGTSQVGVAFFGDGASASPYYFSAVRSATAMKIPVVFVIENNFQYMSVPMARTVPTKYVAEYTKGLDIPHHIVDGNDVSAVYAATQEAVEWARAGNGPSVIEGITYRWYDHSGFSGSREGEHGAFRIPYRTDEEVHAWMSRDPIVRYAGWLEAQGIASADELAGIAAEVKEAVDASVAFARAGADPRPEAGVLNTYASEPAVATQFYNRRGLA
ncbi:MAG: thiamine pyrophosphate-dependent dehydrogenase E1 component subunit alpha [Gemmatimonadota bacterium]